MLTDKQIMDNWYAEVYDQCVTETYDIDCLLRTLGPKPLRVLETACGTGRILVPLAKAGHDAVGFDMDEACLARIKAKAQGLVQAPFACEGGGGAIAWSTKDALKEPWGENFDAVVLAGNVLFNIVTDGDYMEAQRLFIRRAYEALRPGGHAYLDFDYHPHPARNMGPMKKDLVIFEGTDSAGTTGTYRLLAGGGYDRRTKMTFGGRRTQVVTKDGRSIAKEWVSRKRVINLDEVLGWLEETGFSVEQVWGDHQGGPVTRKNHRAVIWAGKNS